MTPTLASVAFVPLAWDRDLDFRNDERLEASTLASRPDDPQTQLQLGKRLLGQGEPAAALVSCRAYATARPASDRANLCIGAALLLQRDARDALPYLRTYILHHEASASGRRTFLAALLAMREFAEADQWVTRWERTYPAASEILEARATLDRHR
jgi:hypothetical protein